MTVFSRKSLLASAGALAIAATGALAFNFEAGGPAFAGAVEAPVGA